MLEGPTIALVGVQECSVNGPEDRHDAYVLVMSEVLDVRIKKPTVT